MPRNFKRFFASVFLVLLSFIIISAQTADGMRERITKAKSYIAVKNYTAAIYELEAIKRETKDQTVHSVVNVLLINSYLEQGDYKRAQDLLNELAKANNPNAAANYMAVAGQVIRSARTQLERYRSLGLSVSDRNLPLEAATDLEKMRQTLELVIEQSKIIGKDRAQTSNAMALLEEATNARGNLAKDEYDAARWRNEAADAREMIANSRSVVVNVDGTTETPQTVNQNTVASNNIPVVTQTTPTNTNGSSANTNGNSNNAAINTNPIPQPQNNPTNNTAVNNTKNETVASNPSQNNNNNTESQPNRTRERRVENNNNQTADNIVQPASFDSSLPIDVGSLVSYAVQQVVPVYPAQARNIRQTGTVRVELVVDEEGKVAEIKKTTGPPLLQSAAKDAAKKWRFRPFMRDGVSVKAIGFIDFSFNL